MSDTADHNCVSFIINVENIHSKTSKELLWKRPDWLSMQVALEMLNWQSVFSQNRDLGSMWYAFREFCNELIHTFVPTGFFFHKKAIFRE